MPAALPIITEVESVNAFADLLTKNPGIVVMKMGAEWCGPCKRIDPLVQAWFDSSPDTAQCVMLDIDENMDIYMFLKNKKRVNGIPAILCWVKGNTNYIPDDMVNTSDAVQVNLFFQRCAAKLGK